MSAASHAFEAAVNAVVDGAARRLEELLRADPGLATARSPAAHRATLLHYVAANGVEDEMQRTPANAVEICRILLAAGAEPDALSASYGGGRNQTPLCLLVSSWHPFERGVQAELARVLVEGGAAVDGLANDGAPLATTLVFGYTSAAEALAAAGARVDNLFFAAGLGDVDAIDRFVADDGTLSEGALGSYAPPVAKPLSQDPREVVQEAFHFAVTHGRRAVALRLLERGADVNGRTTGQHCELPLLQALFVHELELVPLLLERGADPRRRDGKRAETALDAARRSGPLELLRLLERA